MALLKPAELTLLVDLAMFNRNHINLFMIDLSFLVVQ